MSSQESNASRDAEMDAQPRPKKIKEFDGTSDVRFHPKNVLHDVFNSEDLKHNGIDEPGENDPKLFNMKLPSSIRMQKKIFDPATWKIDNEIKFTTEVSAR